MLYIFKISICAPGLFNSESAPIIAIKDQALIFKRNYLSHPFCIDTTLRNQNAMSQIKSGWVLANTKINTLIPNPPYLSHPI